MRKQIHRHKMNRFMLFVVLPFLSALSWGIDWVNKEVVMKQQRMIRIVDKLVIYLLLPLLLLGAWAYSHASEFNTAEQIGRWAEAAASQAARQPGLDVSAEARIDERVAMPACQDTPRTSIHSRSTTAMSVAVECQAPQAWTLYVPVKLESRAEVIVLAANVSAGTVIDKSHIASQTRDTGQLAYGYLTDARQVIGKTARRPMQAGWALSTNDVQAPDVIRRGDRVTLVARTGAVEVRAEGQALSNAGVDGHVRVKNLSTRRVVDGRVTTDGLVAVGH